VLQIVEWLTDLLLGLARRDLVQALKSKLKCCHVFTIVCKGREPSAVTQGLKKKSKEKRKVLHNVENQTLPVRSPCIVTGSAS